MKMDAAVDGRPLELDDAVLLDLSCTLSKALRHRPAAVGVKLDRRGWCDVEDLLVGLGRNGRPTTLEQLMFVVLTNDKQRFAFSPDGLRIRANQGHSIAGVDLQLPKVRPPDRLYHRTARSALAAIEVNGLLRMRRHHVHLTTDLDAEHSIGARSRRQDTVDLEIDGRAMHAAGYAFMRSANGVWLTNAVPPQYVTQMARMGKS